jgi:hypothetical protein
MCHALHANGNLVTHLGPVHCLTEIEYSVERFRDFQRRRLFMRAQSFLKSYLVFIGDMGQDVKEDHAIFALCLDWVQPPPPR